MFRIKSLTLEDFGPYKGIQSLELPAGDGVTIIYGENMRGKTSLLNAIRYALYGKVVTRGSRTMGWHLLGNWERAAEGKYGFKVKLAFSFQDTEYELSRACVPIVTQPRSDEEYRSERFLRRDGVLLGPEECERELNQILPEQVSRFFLFDGELLQEYEELLRDESDMGHRIAAAIERILGLPVLLNARTDVAMLLTDAIRQEGRAAQADNATQQLGTALVQLTEQAENHQREITQLEAALDLSRTRKASIESFLRRYERLGALLTERDLHLEEVRGLSERLSFKKAEVQDKLAVAWRHMLAAMLADRRDAVRAHLRQLEEKQFEGRVGALAARYRADALESGVCPVCYQRVVSIAGGDHPNGSSIEDAAISESIMRAQRELATLGDIADTGELKVTLEIARQLDELKVLLADKSGRVDDIRAMIGEVDPSEYRGQKEEYEGLISEIAIQERGIAAERLAALAIETRTTSVRRQLEKGGGADLERARKRVRMFAGLRDVFDASVSAYRDQLRARVEKDASAIFLWLTTEPDYVGLQINEQYGLTIVHRDGKEIPVRSAGAEHVVALALIAALQRNAPLSGPIVMDSPFGRLDDDHTARIVRALPAMARQVVLLVYGGELDKTMARNELGSKLLSEYTMARVTARHTRLDRGGEAA